MIGILVQSPLALPAALWLAILTFCAIGTFVFSIIRKEAASVYVTAYVAFACFLCLGAIRLIGFQQFKPDDIRNFVGSERRLATICGFIITPPYINKNEQWQFAQFTYADPASSFYVRVREVKTVNGWAKISGTVRVQVDEPVLDLKAGDYIQLYCWLDRFKQPTNPGQFNTAQYLARKGVFVAASVPSRKAIELLKKNSSTGTFIKIKRRLQEIAGQALRGDLDIEGQNYALLQALVLGYRTKIDSDTYRAFQKTGLLHFLCLSGMNFMILFWIIWWLCKTAGLMKRACAAICLAAAGLFLLVIPPQSPAFRAAIMCFVFCASFLFRRRPNPFNTLSLAAVILLLIRPTYLFEPAWQLSFASVLGILLFTGPIEGLVHQKIVDRLEESDTRKRNSYIHMISRIASPVIKIFAVSLAAWLASAGILLHHFYTINYLTSIWTAVVSPLIGAISIIGYLKILIGLVMPSVAAILDIIIAPLSDLLIWLVKLIASWDISEILIGKVSPTIIILYYPFLALVLLTYFRKPLPKKIICTGIAALIIVLVGTAKWHRSYRDNLILSCLDVGHGQAILAQLAGKTNILFDAGSIHKSDIGNRIVAPFLDYAGIAKIDAIMISHSDVDHINGITEIAEHCKVTSIYAGDSFFIDAKTDLCGTAGFLDKLYEKQLEIKNINNIDVKIAANIKVLWPPEQAWYDETLSENDKSVVSLIEFAGRRILLCSDIERFAQKELLRLNPNLKADVVVAPHHGLVKTLDLDFLEKLGADILICSCDRNQYERMLQSAASQPARRREKTPKTFYTAAHGAIAITIEKDGTVRATTFVGTADAQKQQK
jgi:competence protein ComEC